MINKTRYLSRGGGFLIYDCFLKNIFVIGTITCDIRQSFNEAIILARGVCMYNVEMTYVEIKAIAPHLPQSGWTQASIPHLIGLTVAKYTSEILDD